MPRRFLLAGVLGLFVFLAPAYPGPEDRPGQPAKEPSAPARVDRQLLEGVGALAAGQLYQTYLNIGLLADGVAAGTIEKDDARQLLRTAVGLLDLQDRHLTRIAKLDLTRTDREALTRLRKLSTLLHQQAEELDVYWKTEDEHRGSRYEKARQEAWSGISSLLGLKK